MYDDEYMGCYIFRNRCILSVNHRNMCYNAMMIDIIRQRMYDVTMTSRIQYKGPLHRT